MSAVGAEADSATGRVQLAAMGFAGAAADRALAAAGGDVPQAIEWLLEHQPAADGSNDVQRSSCDAREAEPADVDNDAVAADCIENSENNAKNAKSAKNANNAKTSPISNKTNENNAERLAPRDAAMARNQVVDMYSQSQTLLRAGQTAPAIELLLRCHTLCPAAGDPQVTSAVLGNLGAAYVNLGDYPKAIEFHMLAQATARESGDRQEESRHGSNLAVAVRAQITLMYDQAADNADTDLMGARALALKCQTLCAVAGDQALTDRVDKMLGMLSPESASARSQIIEMQEQAQLLLRTGKAAPAKELLLRCHALCPAAGDPQVTNAVLGTLGKLHAALGDHPKAIEVLTLAQATAREIGDRLGECACLGDLGAAHRSAGNYLEAIECHTAGLVISRDPELSNQARATKREQQSSESSHLNGLGCAHAYLGNYAKAVEHQTAALAIARGIGDRRCEAAALGNLAATEQLAGTGHQSNPHTGRLLAMGFGAAAVSHALAASAGGLGPAVEWLLAHPDGQEGGGEDAANENGNGTVDTYTAALAIFREIGDRHNEGHALNNIGAQHFRLGQYAEAQAAYSEAVTAYDSLRDELADIEKVWIFAQQAKAYAGLVKSLLGLGEYAEALLVADCARSRALADLLGKAPSVSAADESRTETELEAAAASSSQRVRPGITVASALDWPAVVALAKQANATLIFFFKDDNAGLACKQELYTWVISPSDNGSIGSAQHISDPAELQFCVHKLPDGHQKTGYVSGLVTDFGRGVHGARDEGSTGAVVAEAEALHKLHALHAALIEPIAGLLPPPAVASSVSAPRLVFIPHDDLCRAPFPALMGGGSDAQPLLAGYEVQVCNSLQVLKLTLDNAKTVRELAPATESLVVGYPQNDLTVRLPWAPEDIQVPKLRGAAAEAATVAKLLGTTALIGPAATREAVIGQLESAPVIHIATHGFVHEGGDKKTVLLLHDDSSDGAASAFLSEVEMNPSTMQLAARLIVLPACHSGRGDDRWTGEGLIGLGRALIACGVPTVILSLWTLPDHAAEVVMGEFYRLLADGSVGGGAMQGDASALLRAAILKQFPGSALKQRWMDWAPLQILGAGAIRLPKPKRKGTAADEPLSLLCLYTDDVRSEGEQFRPLVSEYSVVVSDQFREIQAVSSSSLQDSRAGAGAPLKSMVSFDEMEVRTWVQGVEGLSADQLEAVCSALGEDELDGEELAAVTEKRLAKLLRKTPAEGTAHLVYAARDAHLAREKAMLAWEHAIELLQQRPPKSGAVLCLCGFGVEAPEPTIKAAAVAALVACQPQCLVLSGGGAASLATELLAAGVETVQCWGSEVSVAERSQRSFVAVKQLLEAKVAQRLAATAHQGGEGRYISKKHEQRWTADMARKLMEKHNCSKQKALDALARCGGHETAASAMLADPLSMVPALFAAGGQPCADNECTVEVSGVEHLGLDGMYIRKEENSSVFIKVDPISGHFTRQQFRCDGMCDWVLADGERDMFSCTADQHDDQSHPPSGEWIAVSPCPVGDLDHDQLRVCHFLRAATLYEAMQPTRVMFSFAAVDGGLHLARDMRRDLLAGIVGWTPDTPDHLGQEAYIDTFNLVSKPGTIELKDGQKRNSHWAEFYLMGTLCAHTVVLIIDDEYDDSPWCTGELDAFRANWLRARSETWMELFGNKDLEPEPELGHVDSIGSPGSTFQMLVVYEQGVFGAEGEAKMRQLRARLEGVARVEFFPAWFSCFKAGSIVNGGAETGVAELQEQWDKYVAQTRDQKSGPQAAEKPRVTLDGATTFVPHGIIGDRCEKSTHDAGACADCKIARQRFRMAVQDEDAKMLGISTRATPSRRIDASKETYCALYEHHWRKEAHRLYLNA
jgi:CHAT domain-containing protein/tetratricopeptide (TPR) repeat protein